MPRWETRPIVGLIEYRAHLLAGHTSEPLVSVPIDAGANPAATALADPEDDPEGIWLYQSTLHGVVLDFSSYAMTILRIILLSTSTYIRGLSLSSNGRPAAWKIFAPAESMSMQLTIIPTESYLKLESSWIARQFDG